MNKNPNDTVNTIENLGIVIKKIVFAFILFIVKFDNTMNLKNMIPPIHIADIKL